MEHRTHGYSIVVTICVFCVLAVIAWLYKVGKNEELLSQQGNVTLPVDVGGEGQPEPPRSRELVPAVVEDSPPSDTDFEVLIGCELVESRANDGDTIRVRHREKEYVFRLYFVETPETSVSNPDRIRDQVQYFNYLPDAHLLQVGNEARDYALSLLRQRPFVVFTRWEKLLQTHRYYAFVQVNPPTGERRFLSEQLVERGFASVESNGRKLPNGVEDSVYRQHLRDLESISKKSRVGAWRSVD